MELKDGREVGMLECLDNGVNEGCDGGVGVDEGSEESLEVGEIGRVIDITSHVGSPVGCNEGIIFCSG